MWEQAEFDDEKRKEKFLKLMGGKKKDRKQNEEKAITKVDEATKDDALDSGQETKSAESEQEEAIDVTSANKWEKADLGDTNRRNKFLRLMGASKKEHTGKIVIGDKSELAARQTRSKDELEKGLEDQYNQGLELRLSGAVRRHTGLGFHEEPVKKPEIEANVTVGEPGDNKTQTTEDDEKKRQNKRDIERREVSPRHDSQENRERRDHRRDRDRHGNRDDYRRDRSYDDSGHHKRRRDDDRGYQPGYHRDEGSHGYQSYHKRDYHSKGRPQSNEQQHQHGNYSNSGQNVPYQSTDFTGQYRQDQYGQQQGNYPAQYDANTSYYQGSYDIDTQQQQHNVMINSVPPPQPVTNPQTCVAPPPPPPPDNQTQVGYYLTTAPPPPPPPTSQQQSEYSSYPGGATHGSQQTGNMYQYGQQQPSTYSGSTPATAGFRKPSLTFVKSNDPS